MISIRTATANDADELYMLIRELAIHQGHTQPLNTNAKRIREQITSEHKPFECLIAENQGRIVGFALFFQNYSTWEGRPGIYLEDLYVRPEARGTGVGKMLLTRLTEIATERNYGRIEWSVLSSNISALEFYRRAGASPLNDVILHRIEVQGTTGGVSAGGTAAVGTGGAIAAVG